MIFRVFNGWTANGEIHRIVLAVNEAKAIAAVVELGKRRDDPQWSDPEKLRAERVNLDRNAVELEPYED